MRYALLPFCSFIIAGSGNAGDTGKSFCLPLGSLKASVRSCGQNARYAEASKACLTKIRQEVKNKQAKLSLFFAKNATAAKSSQAAKITNNIMDLSQARQEVEILLGEIARAQAEIPLYVDALEWPDGDAPPQRGWFLAKKYHLEGFLGRFACHSQPHQFLDGDIAALQVIHDQFVRISEKLAGFAGGNSRSVTQLGNATPGRKLSGTGKAPAVGSFKKRKPENKASDITGVPPDPSP